MGFLALLFGVCAAPPLSIEGTVVSSSGAVLKIIGSSGLPFEFHRAATVTAHLRPGDKVDIKFRRQPNGDALALEVSFANALHVEGVVRRRWSNSFVIERDPGVARPSGYPRGNQTISLNSATEFEGLTKTDLRPGLEIEIFGTQKPNGLVEAATIRIQRR